MAGLPAEGDYYIENNEEDRNGSPLYASIYKSSGTDFTAEPKSFSFHQEFTLKYVSKAEGTYTIKKSKSQTSAGVDELKNAEPVITMDSDQDWTITKITTNHFTIGQKQGQKEFVWDLKDPGADDYRIVINQSNNSPYQLWVFRKVA